MPATSESPLETNMNNKPEEKPKEQFSGNKVWPPPILRTSAPVEQTNPRCYGAFALGLVGLEIIGYFAWAFTIPKSSSALPLSLLCLFSILSVVAIVLGAVPRRSWQGITAIVLATMILLFVWWLYWWSSVFASI